MLSLVLKTVPSFQQILCCQEVFKAAIGPPSPEGVAHASIVIGQATFHEFKDERLTQIEIVLVGNLYHLIPIHVFTLDLVNVRHL